MKRCIVLIALAAACTDAKTVVDPNATGFEVVVNIAPGLGVDSVRVSAVGAQPAFAPGTVPDEPHALAGSQSVVVLLPDALADSEVIVRVDGLAGGAVVASGGARATVRLHAVERVDVVLGDPAICGDGIVHDPIEPCDDQNTAVGDGCTADCNIESGFECTTPPQPAPSTCRPDTFDVVSAVSTSHHQIAITFSDPPDPVVAIDVVHFMVPGLTLTGTPFLDGNRVTVDTSAQDGIGYNVIVNGLTRARDGAALTTKVTTFTGRTAFDVMSARSTSASQIAVKFSEPPDPATATVLANYAVPGLTLTGTSVVANDTVTISTLSQSAVSYTVTATGVKRATDGEALGVDQAVFTGLNGFDITGAISLGNRQFQITFNAPPNAAEATNVGNYSVAGLTLSSAVLVDNIVTLETSAQAVITYTVMVNNVTRASDSQPLTIADADFSGLPIADPTVTGVEVLSTVPNNGSTFYNTGTATVRLTGTQFASVGCPGGVVLDDLDGLGAAVGTHPTSCIVDSDTQITATFPAGIRTNGTTGWNVIVTNSAGSNATSDRLIVAAGLVFSEIYVGTNNREFFELYNPTGAAINLTGLGLRLHARNAMGSDTSKNLTIANANLPSHRFFLACSTNSSAADPWFSVKDATYAAGSGIGSNAGVYISTSNSPGLGVLDKVGWGTQPTNGFEGVAAADIPGGQSVERKPAGGQGHAIDTDNNANDFNPASTTLTPRGTADSPEP